MTDREEFSKMASESVAELLKMDFDTYNRVKITLLSYQSEHDACRGYLLKLFAFTDRHRPLLIGMKGGAVI